MGFDEHDSGRLHILFLPLMAPGHMIPMLDIAKLFAGRGVKCTVVTTSSCAAVASSFLRSTSGIDFRLIAFPSSDGTHGLKDLSSLPSTDDRDAFFCSLQYLRPSVEAILLDTRPDAMIADMFFPWATALCSELGLPRLVFYGTSGLASCAMASIHRGGFHEASLSGGDEGRGAEAIELEGLPHRIVLLKTQIPDPVEASIQFAALYNEVMEAEDGCYGVLINSFCDLEPDYARHYGEVLRRRAWLVGPAFLSNKGNAHQSIIPDGVSPTTRRCEEWLHSKQPGSVLYICFGSLVLLDGSQLREISIALESIHHPFIWVVPEALGDRSQFKWLSEVIRSKEAAGESMLLQGWAPQMLILNHASVGGFMTHCGWNSSLETIAAGVPVATWPLFGDQFYNERLLVDVLKVGVAVGSEHNSFGYNRPTIAATHIQAAIEGLMGNGDESVARRQRVKELAAAARGAVVEGGSSFESMSRLIEELKRRPFSTASQHPRHDGGGSEGSNL